MLTNMHLLDNEAEHKATATVPEIAPHDKYTEEVTLGRRSFTMAVVGPKCGPQKRVVAAVCLF